MVSTSIRVLLMQVFSMLIPVGGCCAIVSHFIYRSKHPYKHPKLAKAFWLTVAVLIVGGGLAFGVMLVQSMYNFTSKTKVNSENSRAHDVCNAFQSAVAELDRTGELPEQSEEIYSGHFGDAAEEKTLEWYMNQYSNNTGYYVVVTDGNWNVKYTLASQEPITSDKIHIYDLAAQREEMRRMFRNHDDFVGCFNYEQWYTERQKEKQSAYNERMNQTN